MSAYDELTATGSLGRDGVALLYRTVAAVARVHRFPPPEGYSTWTTDAVTEVAQSLERPSACCRRPAWRTQGNDGI